MGVGEGWGAHFCRAREVAPVGGHLLLRPGRGVGSVGDWRKRALSSPGLPQQQSPELRGFSLPRLGCPSSGSQARGPGSSCSDPPVALLSPPNPRSIAPGSRSQPLAVGPSPQPRLPHFGLTDTETLATQPATWPSMATQCLGLLLPPLPWEVRFPGLGVSASSSDGAPGGPWPGASQRCLLWLWGQVVPGA